eukprot:scaffold113977_cov28-Tisochrysis_lutea.AAC.7
MVAPLGEVWPWSTKGARRRESTLSAGAEASVNMPRPTDNAIARRQASARRPCCSYAASCSAASREPAELRSEMGREEQSKRLTYGQVAAAALGVRASRGRLDSGRP